MTHARQSGRTMLRALIIATTLSLAPASTLAHNAALTDIQASASAPFASSRFSVEVIGQGPDVILVPGLASSRDVWRPIAERLSQTHQVHLVQLAGFAGQPWTEGDSAVIQPFVDDLARYAATLDRPAVIGHSMGGLSALLLAQQHPDVVGRIMSVDSLPFYSAMFGPQVTVENARPFADQMAAQIMAADAETFARLQTQTAQGMMMNEAGRPAMIADSLATDRQIMARAMSEVMTTDARSGLGAMTTPVWAVYAAGSNPTAPAGMADALWGREYATLPGVRIERVDDARHFIMVDQPKRMTALIEEFLSESRP